MYPDPATVTLGDTPVAVSCDVLSYKLTPNTNVCTRKTMCGSTTQAPEPDWVLTIEYDQNWAASGMAQWLIDQQRTQQAFEIDSEGLGKVATGTVLVVAGEFGGKAGEDAAGTVQLPVIGQPTFADPTP